MKVCIPVCLLATVILLNTQVLAKDKVVVIPLNVKSSITQQFTYNGNGTITDNLTELMWQNDDVESFSISAAHNYCDGLQLGGKMDWRLPTKEELKGLVRCSNGPSTPLPDNTPCNDGHREPPIITILKVDPPYLPTYTSTKVDDYTVWFVSTNQTGQAFTSQEINGYLWGKTRCVR
jgi:Protein of unknown function (DUF1566)